MSSYTPWLHGDDINHEPYIPNHDTQPQRCLSLHNPGIQMVKEKNQLPNHLPWHVPLLLIGNTSSGKKGFISAYTSR